MGSLVSDLLRGERLRSGSIGGVVCRLGNFRAAELPLLPEQVADSNVNGSHSIQSATIALSDWTVVNWRASGQYSHG
jgi:hypothetical protein